MKTKTIDDICGSSEGTFHDFIKRKNEILRLVEENRKVHIRAHRAGKPLPELPFEVELWMLS